MCTFGIQVMLSGAEEAFPRSVLEVLLGIIDSCPSNMVLNLSQTLIYIIWRLTTLNLYSILPHDLYIYVKCNLLFFWVKVESKIVPLHVMKAYSCSKGTRWRRVVNFLPQLIYLPEKSSGIHSIWGWMGHAEDWAVWRRKESLDPAQNWTLDLPTHSLVTVKHK